MTSLRTITIGAFSLLLMASAQVSAQELQEKSVVDMLPTTALFAQVSQQELSAGGMLPSTPLFAEAMSTISANPSDESVSQTADRVCAELGLKCSISSDTRAADINALRQVRVNQDVLGGIAPDGREFIIRHELGHVETPQSSQSIDDTKVLRSSEMKSALAKFFYVKKMDQDRADLHRSFQHALAINSFDHFQSRPDMSAKEKELILSYKAIKDQDEYGPDRFAAQQMFCAASKHMDPVAASRLTYRAAVHGLAGSIIMAFSNDISFRPSGTDQSSDQYRNESHGNIIELIVKSEAIDHPTTISRINAVGAEVERLERSADHREAVCGTVDAFVPANRTASLDTFR